MRYTDEFGLVVIRGLRYTERCAVHREVCGTGELYTEVRYIEVCSTQECGTRQRTGHGARTDEVGLVVIVVRYVWYTERCVRSTREVSIVTDMCPQYTERCVLFTQRCPQYTERCVRSTREVSTVTDMCPQYTEVSGTGVVH